MYHALHDYQEIKQMESYLIIRDRITNECSHGIKENFLEQLKIAYQTGNDLMDVLRMMLKQKSVEKN